MDSVCNVDRATPTQVRACDYLHVWLQAYQQWKLNDNEFFPMRRAVELEFLHKEEEGIDKLQVSSAQPLEHPSFET